MRTIKVTVEAPEHTPGDATLFVAGDFNAWHASSPQHKLEPNGDGKFHLALTVDEPEVKFKITRGSWDSVECNADGTPVEDRQWSEDELDEPMSFAVEGWLDLHPNAVPYRPKHTITGDLRTLQDVYAPHLTAFRDLFVYLPPSYEANHSQRFPVLYMQDGQNLFDDVTSFAGEWHVDETCQQLAKDDGLEIIVVGIPNFGKRRLFEYGPWLDEHAKEGGGGTAYVSFVADVVKPLVDKSFRTSAARHHTGIMGSSMGGLISLFAGFLRPEVFGAVGAMSSSLLFAGGKITEFVESSPTRDLRVYIDSGGEEYPGLKARSRRQVEVTERMANLLVRKGCDVNLVIDPAAHHNEAAWSKRFPSAVKYLFG